MKLRAALLISAISLGTMAINAISPIRYRGTFLGYTASGDFTPYYLASNSFGVNASPHAALLRAALDSPMDSSMRWSYDWGADIIGGYRSSISYQEYSDHSLRSHSPVASSFRLQQLYASVKYRRVFLSVGLKEAGSYMLDDALSSGDITWSANSRPMPGVRAGFLGYVDIPFTSRWLQINGELFFGKPTDNHWLEDHYNYYNSFITTGRYISYKRVYFRTCPDKRFHAVIGMQAASQFGGTKKEYDKGVLTKTEHSSSGFKDFLSNIIPRKEGGEGYYEGNHLGSWDIKLNYRIGSAHTVSAYMQSPWEDGSGIGKLNGWDGLWGISYSSSAQSLVTGAVIEYLDFTNQSGPLHWDPADHPGTTITDQATGSDSYYNNYFYNGYAYYGMSQGTPFLKSPLYNLDGYMRYVDTRVRGFHVAFKGCIIPSVDYRILASHRTSWGDSYAPRLNKVHDTSVALQATWTSRSINGLCLSIAVAMDHGDMYGNSFGTLLTVSYQGIIKNLRP